MRVGAVWNERIVIFLQVFGVLAVGGGLAAQFLDGPPGFFVIHPAFFRGFRGPSGLASLGDFEGIEQQGLKAFFGHFFVAVLRTAVFHVDLQNALLGESCAQPSAYPRFLMVTERTGIGNRPMQSHPRAGFVGVLTARAGRATGGEGEFP